MTRPRRTSAPPSLINLQESGQSTGFFECVSCSTHIALNRNGNASVCYTPVLEVGTCLISVVNVHVEAESCVMNTMHVDGELYCKGCYNNIGWKLAPGQRFFGLYIMKSESIKLNHPTSQTPPPART